MRQVCTTDSHRIVQTWCRQGTRRGRAFSCCALAAVFALYALRSLWHVVLPEGPHGQDCDDAHEECYGIGPHVPGLGDPQHHGAAAQQTPGPVDGTIYNSQIERGQEGGDPGTRMCQRGLVQLVNPILVEREPVQRGE